MPVMIKLNEIKWIRKGAFRLKKYIQIISLNVWLVSVGMPLIVVAKDNQAIEKSVGIQEKIELSEKEQRNRKMEDNATKETEVLKDREEVADTEGSGGIQSEAQLIGNEQVAYSAFLEKSQYLSEVFVELSKQVNKILGLKESKLNAQEELSGYKKIIDDTISEIDQLVIKIPSLLSSDGYAQIQQIKDEVSQLFKKVMVDQNNKKAHEISEQKKRQEKILAEPYQSDVENGVISVGSEGEFKKAYENDDIKKIILMNNVSGKGTLTRSKSIEIDGQGFSLIFGSLDLERTGGAVQIADFHDVKLGSSAGLSASVIDVNTRAKGQWVLRFGNVIAKDDETGIVERLARADRSMIEIYDKVEIRSRAENFYLGGMKILPGADYLGEVTVHNFSVLWYIADSNDKDTGREGLFQVGEKATANLIHQRDGATGFPAVFSYFNKMEIMEEATFIVNMPGNAIRLQRNNSEFIQKKGSVVNATSRARNMPIISFSGSNQLFKSEPGANLYLIGSGSSEVINMSASDSGGLDWPRSNNQMILDRVASYDLRNKSKGKVLRIGGKTNSFEINQSDIDLWLKKSEILGPSNESYPQVNNFKLTGTKVESSELGLSRFKEADYSRISGMNQQPIAIWDPVTDADKSYRVRVKIGEAPANDLGPNSNIIWLPVYAAEGQGQVTVINTYGEEKSEVTGKPDKEGLFGYATVKEEAFNRPGRKMTATAKRGSWETATASETVVLDVTPPEPAVVDQGETIGTTTRILTGTGEPGADLLVAVNNVNQPTLKARVGIDGRWQLDIPRGSLKKGDQIQLFLQDHSGKRTEIANPPQTNNEIGNINPVSDLHYRDAIFKKGTIIDVVGTLAIEEVPVNFDFGSHKIGGQAIEFWPDVDGKLSISDNRGSGKKEWEVTIREEKGLTSGVFKLPGVIHYKKNGIIQLVGIEEQVIYQDKLKDDGQVNISDEWQKGENGLFLQIPIEKQRKGTFKGSVRWLLRDVPR